MSSNDSKSSMMNVEQALNQAVQHHQAGRLAEAETIYQQILIREPSNSEVLNLLGVVLSQQGQYQAALGLIIRAIEINPQASNYHNNLGQVLLNLRWLDEAIRAYRKALNLKPDDPELLNNLGNALNTKGGHKEAAMEFNRAIKLQPDYAAAHYNLGNALSALGQTDAAIAAYQNALALKPDLVEARINLGNAFKIQNRFAEAVREFHEAVKLKPNFAEAHNNLGNLFNQQQRIEEAIAEYRLAIAHKPDFAEAHYNLGNTLKDRGRFDEAIIAYCSAVAFKPSYPEAHYNLAILLLLKGDFKRGWQEYEWRWKWANFTSPPRNFSQPQWDGSPLENRTLLLHAEQGLGDTIQFIRYVSLAARRGGKIIIGCQAELQRLFRIMPEGCQIVVQGALLPNFDLHCPLLSLPLVFGTTLENIPNTVPYLYADVQDAKSWQQRLDEHSPGLKVGLVWAGSPTHDPQRFIKLSNLAPLGQVSGVRFFSLQKGEASIQAKTPPAGMELIDWTAELKDFADTAALIANLDLVITIDTAAVHLAGALGKPVWTLLPFIPDWRWMLEREDSPWYPTMRLFRQSIRGDWDGVIKRVAEALSIWTKSL